MTDAKKACRRDECPPSCALQRWCQDRGLDGVCRSFFPAWQSSVYSRGNVLFHPGNMPVALFFVCKGRVKLTRAEGGGRQTTVRIARAPDFVGARALIAEQPYQAMAEVMDESVVCMIEAARFRTLWDTHPALAREMARELASKLGEAEEHLADLSLRTIVERVAKDLAKRAERGGPEYELQESRGEMADLLGTSATVLCRALTALEKRGVVQLEGRRVRVLDEARLRAAARMPRA